MDNVEAIRARHEADKGSIQRIANRGALDKYADDAFVSGLWIWLVDTHADRATLLRAYDSEAADLTHALTALEDARCDLGTLTAECEKWEQRFNREIGAWIQENSKLQVTLDAARAVLEHSAYRTHGYFPDGCSACEQHRTILLATPRGAEGT